MLESALWLVKFTSEIGGYGSGVISFRNGHVYGGDSFYYYFGGYSLNEGNTVTATVNVKQHTSGLSIFGPINQFTLDLKGSIQQTNAILIGFIKEKPDMKITAILQKLRDI